MASTKQLLETCKHCKKRKFDMKRGLVCSITDEKPDFRDFCPSYNKDIAEYNRIHKGGVEGIYSDGPNKEPTSNRRTIYLAIGIIVLILKIALMISRN